MYEKTYTFSDIFYNKGKILFVMAHPDDAEVFFGGLIFKLRQDAKKVFVLITTNGGRGSREKDIPKAELIKIRKEESLRALGLLGIARSSIEILPLLDGEIENNLRFSERIVRVIRKFRPDIVCTHEPSGFIYEIKEGFTYVHHRDHRITGQATMDAVYPLSRDCSFFPEHKTEGLRPHIVKEILLTPELKNNCEFDITEQYRYKEKALMLHKSQFTKEGIKKIMSRSRVGKRYIERGNYLKLVG